MNFRNPNYIAVLVALAAMATPPLASAETAGPGDQRIIGGSTAPEGKYPFAVSIQAPAKTAPSEHHTCGGTLISSEIVLTAAHCVEAGSPSGRPWPDTAEVALGSQDIDRPGVVTVGVEAVAMHPRWDSDRQRYDAALLSLSEPAPAGTPTVAVAGPGDEALSAPGQVVQAIGWGFGNPDGGKLQEAILSILADPNCQAVYADFWVDFDPTSQLCAQGDRQSVCFGDSGGPILAPDPTSGALKQVGIVSWGKSAVCNPSAGADVFTRLAAIHDFVTDPTPVWRPEPRKSPTITGKARVGESLRCRGARFRNHPASVRYEWDVVDSIGHFRVISDLAHGRSYEPRRDDIGLRLQCVAEGRSTGGTTQSKSRNTPEIAPAREGPPDPG